MAPMKRYYPEQMLKAIEAVKKGSKVLTAARKYGVPRITLRNKITGKSPVVCAMGPPSIVTKEQELEFVRWLYEMSERHCPVGKEHILDTVQQFVIKNNIENPFTNNRPGKNWFYAFTKRHPGVSEKISQNFFTSLDITQEKLKSWFSDIYEYLQKNNLLDVIKDARRIFTSDEAVFYLNPKTNRVLVKRSASNIYSMIGNKKVNPRVFLTANAMGDLLPPMVVFADQSSYFRDDKNIPEGWGVGRTKTGWMCGITFYDYMTNIFHPWLIENNIKLPVIYFLDGDATHLTYQLSEFCSKNQIELLALYPNTAKVQKTMDVALFRPLRAFWKKECNVWKKKNYNKEIKREHFGQILEKALQSITPACIRNGFKVGGLFPFGHKDVDFRDIKPIKIEKTAPDPKDIQFLNTLEKEIVVNFTQSKIDLFNAHYTNNISANDLPKEDELLYTIWSKYKDKCRDDNNKTEESVDFLYNTSAEPKFTPDNNINFKICLESDDLERALEGADSDSERSYLSLSDESNDETAKGLPSKAATRLLFHNNKRISRVRIKEESKTTKSVNTVGKMRELHRRQVNVMCQEPQKTLQRVTIGNKRKIEPEKKVVKRPRRIIKEEEITSSEETTEPDITMSEYDSDDESLEATPKYIKEEKSDGSDGNNVGDSEGKELSVLDLVKTEVDDDSVIIYVTKDDVNIICY